MYKTAKRKINDVEIEDKIKYMPESKKKKNLTINSLIIDYKKSIQKLHVNYIEKKQFGTSKELKNIFLSN